MPSPLSALNLIATPGQRRATLEMAREIERRGFAQIQVSSSFANMAQCTGLAFATERIGFATAIAPIYAQTVEEFAHTAAYIHEISGGPVSVRDRRRARPEPCPHGHHPGEAARRRPRLRREVPILRPDRRSGADRLGDAAQAHGRARRRDRRWPGVLRWQPSA